MPPVEATEEILQIVGRLKRFATRSPLLEETEEGSRVRDHRLAMGESDMLLRNGKRYAHLQASGAQSHRRQAPEREQAQIAEQYRKSAISRPILLKKGAL